MRYYSDVSGRAWIYNQFKNRIHGGYSYRERQLLHSAGRALNSDWPVNSFIMIVYDIFFKLTLQSEFLSKALLKEVS